MVEYWLQAAEGERVDQESSGVEFPKVSHAEAYIAVIAQLEGTEGPSFAYRREKGAGKANTRMDERERRMDDDRPRGGGVFCRPLSSTHALCLLLLLHLVRRQTSCLRYVLCRARIQQYRRFHIISYPILGILSYPRPVWIICFVCFAFLFLSLLPKRAWHLA